MSRRPLVTATIAILAAIAIAAVLYYIYGPERRRVQTASQSPIVGKAQVGQPAPAFEVATTAGLFDLSKAEKPVFLEVFATWCPHCQREAAIVDKVYRKYRGSVDFVAVSGSDTAMDGTSASSQRDVLDWARRFKVEYPVAYDPLLNVANLYLQSGFPTFAVIARNKRITYLDSGEVSLHDLDSAVAKVAR